MIRATRRDVLAVMGTLAAALVATSTTRRSFADELDAALAEVVRARAGLKTLVGPFTQERTIGLLAAKVRSTGTLTLVRPDRLRWELAAPDSVVYWVGPDGVAYKSARGHGRMPAGQGKLAAALDDVRVLLGGDLARLRARYDLRVLSRGLEGIAFEATPRQGAGSSLEKLTFALDKDRVRPTHAILVEGPRDRTEIVFGALERDVNVDPAWIRPPD